MLKMYYLLKSKLLTNAQQTGSAKV